MIRFHKSNLTKSVESNAVVSKAKWGTSELKSVGRCAKSFFWWRITVVFTHPLDVFFWVRHDLWNIVVGVRFWIRVPWSSFCSPLLDKILQLTLKCQRSATQIGSGPCPSRAILRQFFLLTGLVYGFDSAPLPVYRIPYVCRRRRSEYRLNWQNNSSRIAIFEEQ